MNKFIEFINNPPVMEFLITEVLWVLLVCMIIWVRDKRKKNNKVFISGKVSGTDLEETKRKFTSAERVAERYFRIEFGYYPKNVINPTQLGLTNADSWLMCMIVCIWHLLKCNTIFMLSDWKESRGARIEHRIAKFLRYEIIYQK